MNSQDQPINPPSLASLALMTDAQRRDAVQAHEEEFRKQFEALYGQDSKTRTPEQWTRLVQKYGMSMVCTKEKMTVAEVMKKCKNISYSEKLKTAFKQAK